MRTAYLIVGSIGSGKSSIADFLLSSPPLDTLEYVGSDVYKRRFFGDPIADRKRGYRCADELVFYRIEQICKTNRDFAFEFCPTNPNKLQTFRHLIRKYSYGVVSFFVATERYDINIARCRQREADGADAVPDEKIRNRYSMVLNRALEMIELSAKIYFIDNSADAPKLVAVIVDNAISVSDNTCGWFKMHVQQKLA